MDCCSLLDGWRWTLTGNQRVFIGYYSNSVPLSSGLLSSSVKVVFFFFTMCTEFAPPTRPTLPEFCVPPVRPGMVHNHWCVRMMSGCFSFMSPRMNPRGQQKRVIPYDASTVRIPPSLCAEASLLRGRESPGPLGVIFCNFLKSRVSHIQHLMSC